MVSGGQILWNAITTCEMTKTSWQKVNLKMNEDLGNLSGYALIAVRIWEEDILTAEIEELKSWMHQKEILEDWMRKKSW